MTKRNHKHEDNLTKLDDEGLEMKGMRHVHDTVRPAPRRAPAIPPEGHDLTGRIDVHVHPHRLKFRFPAGTSRGVYLTRDILVLELVDTVTGAFGFGECAPLPDLSIDAAPMEVLERRLLAAALHSIRHGGPDAEALRGHPSVLFALETAWRHLRTGSPALYETAFSKGAAGIPINGLVWMGTFEEMRARIDAKLSEGFTCLKLKIGAIDFEDEFELLRRIRRRWSPEDLVVRVDANGGFTPGEAMAKLDRLATLGLHSIEQPVKAGMTDVLARICRESPLPVALDEELIRVTGADDRRRLLEEVRPAHVVIKPGLHGGFAGAAEWISEAKRIGAGWWITSALESNIGLNAIAQWTARFAPAAHQGLGTGALFTENFGKGIRVERGRLHFDPKAAQRSFTREALSGWLERGRDGGL